MLWGRGREVTEAGRGPGLWAQGHQGAEERSKEEKRKAVSCYRSPKSYLGQTGRESGRKVKASSFSLVISLPVPEITAQTDASIIIGEWGSFFFLTKKNRNR